MQDESGLQTCTVALLAQLYGLSERRVQQLAKEGVFIRNHHGEYDLVASVRSYTEYFKTLAEKEDEPLKQERLRLLKAQAKHAEYVNHLLLKEWLPFSEFKQALEEIGAVYIACIDALPGRLAFDLTGINDPAFIKAKLFEACRHIRSATGDALYELAKNMRARDGASKENPSTTPEDTGRVGG
jgi:hypothetical protein